MKSWKPSLHRRLQIESLEDRQLLASDFIDPTFAREFAANLGHEQVLEVAKHTDGRLVLLARSGIAQLARDGTRNMTFASDGFFDLDSSLPSSQVMVDSQDRIVFMQQTLGSHHTEIVRLLDDGQSDLSFGDNGISAEPPSGRWRQLITVLPDGALIAVSVENDYSPTAVLRKISA